MCNYSFASCHGLETRIQVEKLSRERDGESDREYPTAIGIRYSIYNTDMVCLLEVYVCMVNCHLRTRYCWLCIPLSTRGWSVQNLIP